MTAMIAMLINQEMQFTKGKKIRNAEKQSKLYSKFSKNHNVFTNQSFFKKLQMSLNPSLHMNFQFYQKVKSGIYSVFKLSLEVGLHVKILKSKITQFYLMELFANCLPIGTLSCSKLVSAILN